jgi:hypothetical protein
MRNTGQNEAEFTVKSAVALLCCTYFACISYHREYSCSVTCELTIRNAISDSASVYVYSPNVLHYPDNVPDFQCRAALTGHKTTSASWLLQWASVDWPCEIEARTYLLAAVVTWPKRNSVDTLFVRPFDSTDGGFPKDANQCKRPGDCSVVAYDTLVIQ